MCPLAGAPSGGPPIQHCRWTKSSSVLGLVRAVGEGADGTGPGVSGISSAPHGWGAARCEDPRMTVARSIILFVLAALAEIGGAWLVWQGVREHGGGCGSGRASSRSGLYGFVATLQPDANFGRILAAYGGVFVAGSLLWGMVVDGFRRTGSTSPERCSASSGSRSSCTRPARSRERRPAPGGGCVELDPSTDAVLTVHDGFRWSELVEACAGRAPRDYLRPPGSTRLTCLGSELTRRTGARHDR